MDQLPNIIREGLSNYIKKLKTFGYVNYSHVDSLIIAIFIQEILSDNKICLTEAEYRVFEQVLYTLFKKQCLLPYPKYFYNISNITNPLIIKLSESKVLRTDEDGLLKKV